MTNEELEQYIYSRTRQFVGAHVLEVVNELIASSASDKQEAWTYDQVVMLCETDGVPLPVEFIEWVAEKMTYASNFNAPLDKSASDAQPVAEWGTPEYWKQKLANQSRETPAGLTEREQFIWNLGYLAALEKSAPKDTDHNN